jgi:hypothetical protein
VRARATSAVKQEVSLKFGVCVTKICRSGTDALSALEREIADRQWLVVGKVGEIGEIGEMGKSAVCKEGLKDGWKVFFDWAKQVKSLATRTTF